MKKQVQRKKMGVYDMAAAGDRVLAFWENNPNGKIATQKTEEEGYKVFKSFIWKDKKDLISLLAKGIKIEDAYGSADSEGTARMNPEKNKDFEKLETISIGRALAALGYLKDGQIASTEELEEFEKYKDDKADEERAMAKEQAIDNLKACKDLATLRETYVKSGFANDVDVTAVKDEMKEKLTLKPKKPATPKKEKETK